MSEIKENLRYSATHEWVESAEADLVRVGISDHAQQLLGDVVFVELPEVGQQFGVGDEIAVIESVKAAADVYAPVTGEVVSVNEDLQENPELINAQPYEDGWIFQMRLSDSRELDALKSGSEYAETIDHD